MKILLTTITLTLALILLAMPAFSDQTETSALFEAQQTEISADDATRAACPDCSGVAHTITGVTFENGMNCTCTGTVSLAVGMGTTVKSGATVAFKAPAVSVLNGARFEAGSSVSLIPGFYPLAITAVANPASIPADGSTYSLVTATLKDNNGQPWPQGTSVTFTTNLGTFGNGTKSQTESTNSSSQAAVALRGTTVGTATVTATSNGVAGPATVTFYSAAPSGITVSANPTTLEANGTSTSSITASVTGGGGGAVPDGTVVAFSVTSGTGTLSASSATTTNGLATVIYTAPSAAPAQGYATISAETNSLSDTVNVTLTGEPAPPGAGAFGLRSSQNTVKSANIETSTITAIVLDTNNAVLPGVNVIFSANGGQISASSAQTNASGAAEITFSSGLVDLSNQTATITAVAQTLTKSIPVQIVGSTVTLESDKTTIDDASITAELVVTAKDATGATVYDAPITLSDSGSGDVDISPNSGNTDVFGQLTATITGTSPGTVTVTANWAGTQASRDYTVSSSGTGFEIILPSDDPFSTFTQATGAVVWTGDNTTIAFVNGNPATITRTAGSFTVDGFLADDQIMVGGSTDNDGVYTVDTVAAGTLTLIAADTLTPEAAGDRVNITNGVLVRVRALTQTDVVFATTIGGWDGTVSPIVTKAVTSGYVWAVLNATEAGAATVQAYDADDLSNTDKTTVAFSAPSADAHQITLQSSTSIVAPSIGDATNTATLTATVRSDTGQVVGGAVVAFSIVNATGGGETVSPVVVVTDSSGVAHTTFTSGSLSTGAEGVTVNARVVGNGETVSNTTISFANSDPDTITRADGGSFVTDGFEAGEQIRVAGSTSNDGYYTLAAGGVAANTLTLVNSDSLTTEAAGASVTITAVTTSVNIVIGGTAGSVVIGRGTVVTVLDPATYSLPMSVLVADSNGNPVAGAVVSLSAWPLQYSSGVWFDNDPDPQAEKFLPYITGTFPNEDTNENMFLDPGEDTNGDGSLTPPNSAAGDVPTTVTTDENGVANFDLIYVKGSAVWIVDRIRASTLALGTETVTSMEFRLPYLRTEGEIGYLPDSNYPIGLVTNTTADIEYTFSTFKGTGDVFSTTGSLSAGSSRMGGVGETVSNTIAFVDSNPDTITRTVGSFITDGFEGGNQIRVLGSASNDGYYTLASNGVTALTLTLLNSDSLIAEIAGPSVTITALNTDYNYIYDPTGGTTAAVVGDTVWDYISVFNNSAFVDAYFPVRIIIK
jgi:hypothetical protein